MRLRLPKFLMIASPALLTWLAIVFATTVVVQLPTATEAQAQSASTCERLAHDYARRRAQRDAFGNVATGALVGAGIGSLANNSRGARRGAAWGAGAGLLSATAGSDYERHFNREFRRCMRI